MNPFCRVVGLALMFLIIPASGGPWHHTPAHRQPPATPPLPAHCATRPLQWYRGWSKPAQHWCAATSDVVLADLAGAQAAAGSLLPLCLEDMMITAWTAWGFLGSSGCEVYPAEWLYADCCPVVEEGECPVEEEAEKEEDKDDVKHGEGHEKVSAMETVVRLLLVLWNALAIAFCGMTACALQMTYVSEKRREYYAVSTPGTALWTALGVVGLWWYHRSVWLPLSYCGLCIPCALCVIAGSAMGSAWAEPGEPRYMDVVPWPVLSPLCTVVPPFWVQKAASLPSVWARVVLHTHVPQLHRPRRAEPPVLQLPPDVWDIVLDFVECCAMGRTCQWAHGALQGRCVRLRSVPLLIMGQLRACTPRARALHVSLRAVVHRGSRVLHTTHVLQALAGAPHLRKLTLCLKGELAVAPGGQQVAHLHIAALATACNLHDLTLDLSEFKYLGPDGKQALAGLESAPFLQTLTIRLANQHLTYRATQPLKALKDAPSLRTLALDLSDNSPSGNNGLGGLHATVQLQSLTIQLQGNCVSRAGLEDLARLRLAPYLHTLCLGLRSSYVSLSGARQLALLSATPNLRVLRLDLAHSQVDNTAALALAGLKAACLLQSLTLDLTENFISDAGADSLAGLGAAPCLETLSLTLCCNYVCDDGVRALAALGQAPALRILTLDVRGNCLGALGMQALKALQSSPGRCAATVYMGLLEE